MSGENVMIMHESKVAKVVAYAKSLGMDVTQSMTAGFYNEKSEFFVYSEIRLQSDLKKLAKEHEENAKD